MDSRLPASPCRNTIAGQPAAGGEPSGRYKVAAIDVPSSIGIERSCFEKADPVASPTKRTRAPASAVTQAFTTAGKGR